jgi:plasmid maintenance system antidote protein VapI
VAAWCRRDWKLGRLRGTAPKRKKLPRPAGPENLDSQLDVPIDRLTIQLRTFVERIKRKPATLSPRKLSPSDWALIFDTETTTCPSQKLRFGSYQLRRRGELRERGVFYDPDTLSAANIQTIERVIAAEREKYPADRIYAMTRTEFVESVLLDKAYALGAIIVGFNLPFDLSRLAIGHSSARGRMKGGFSFRLSQRRDRPNLRIKHLNRRSAFIDFAATKAEAFQENDEDESRLVERGYFVDLKTLSATLTDESHTLESLSELLKVATPKLESDEHGRELTEEYIRYGIRDSQTTWECFESLSRRYASYGLQEVGLHELFSEASLGKAYLRAMNVRPWNEVQGKLPSKIIGHIMSAYFGGRSEVHLRREIAQVLHCDFMSMYPTVCTLMGLWRFVIADGIDWNDDTAAVRQFVNVFESADLQSPEAWKHLAVIVKVLPDDDVFPVRAQYPIEGGVHLGGHVATIGLNRLSSRDPLWFTLADCMVSKILTGKSPRIVQAIRFAPRQVQEGLRTISIAGNDTYRIDPTVHDFYKRLVELRRDVLTRLQEASTAERPSLKSDELAIKSLANATSYGIFVELNVEDLAKPEPMVCLGWKDRPWEVVSKRYEKPGKYFHPLVGALITGAARLMLALAERRALDEGLGWTFCDTDSLAIAKPGNLDQRTFVRRALAVCDWFKSLNPYGDPNSERHSILQVENINYRDGDQDRKELVPLYCLAVSAKRYVLFNRAEDGAIIIRKASGHGLGHLVAPYEDAERNERIKRIGVELWEEDLWREIIRATIDGHPNEVPLDHLPGFDRPAASRYAATTPTALSWFRGYNENCPAAERVWPFNFLLSLQAKSVVQSAAEEPHSAAGRRRKRRQPRPAAPFDKNVLKAAAKAFDRVSGEPIPPEWLLSLGRSLVRYHLHPEAKFRGGDYDQRGPLSRRHVLAETIQPIGKEADKLEERELVGSDDAAIEYDLSPDDRARFVSIIKGARSEFSLRELAATARVSHHHVNDIARGKPVSDNILIRLNKAVEFLRRDAEHVNASTTTLLRHLQHCVTERGRNRVARDLGIDSSNLTKILTGRRRLNVEMIAKLETYLVARYGTRT